MIYLRYFNAEGLKSDPCLAHTHCIELLEHALWREKSICLSNETVVCNPWGKPSLKDHPSIHYNLSHCPGLAACATADVPVGIDVEAMREFSPYAARRVCSKAELQAIEAAEDPCGLFFRLWTLKESCVKAMGTGLAYSVRQIAFQITGNDAVCLNQPDYQFKLWEDASGFIVAVCYRRLSAASDCLLGQEKRNG